MPIYCETPALVASFAVEPINTWSNLFIIAVGLLAITIVARRPGRPHGRSLWILAILLTITGVGSFLWHGWREPGFLILDAVPGALFLFIAAYLWMRRFYSRTVALVGVIAFALLEALSAAYGADALSHQYAVVSMAPVLALTSAWLIARTYGESLRAAALGGGALALALAAIYFRSIDLSVCETFAIGTHFIWHLLLSLSALFTILSLIVIDYSRYFSARSKIRMDVHHQPPRRNSR